MTAETAQQEIVRLFEYQQMTSVRLYSAAASLKIAREQLEDALTSGGKGSGRFVLTTKRGEVFITDTAARSASDATKVEDRLPYVKPRAPGCGNLAKQARRLKKPWPRAA